MNPQQLIIGCFAAGCIGSLFGNYVWDTFFVGSRKVSNVLKDALKDAMEHGYTIKYQPNQN